MKRNRLTEIFNKYHISLFILLAIPADKFLRENVPANEWLVVHYDAGAIPFYSKLKTIDFGMINDEFLAHNKNINMGERVDYFYSRNPGALVFVSHDRDYVKHSGAADFIISDKRFEDYSLVKKFGSNAKDDYFQFVFLRNDLIRTADSPGNIKTRASE